MDNTAIIIPTYNASHEIIDLLDRIKKTVPKAIIFVVDDNSPDGTANLIIERYSKAKNIKVIQRKGKNGRGSAVLAGFKEALENKSLQYFIEMDADLCHDPKYIPKLITVGQKKDIVIASKYHPKSTIKGLTIKRLVMSKIMNKAARIILHVPITDYTNGYRCYNRRVIEYLIGQEFSSRGFVVLSEIVYICYKKGFSFSEIPFNFIQVSTGRTNLNLKEINEAIHTLIKLRFT